MISSLVNKYRIIPASLDHMEPILADLRDSDRKEFSAMGTIWTLAHECRLTLQCSCEAHTVLVNEKPVMMFGVVPLNLVSGIGSPWLFGSKEMDNHSKKFIRYSRSFLQELLKRWPVLINSVDNDNIKTKRWLEWMGFNISNPVQFGNGQFCPFEIRG